MKKVYFISLIILLTAGCRINENKKKEFSISGIIKDSDYKEVILSEVQYNNLKNIDTSLIKKGHFEFQSIPFHHPKLYCLLFDDRKMIVEFFSDLNDIKMTIHGGKELLLEVSKSQTHAEFVAFLEDNRIFESKRESIFKQHQIAAINQDTARISELDSMTKEVDKEQIMYIKDYIQQKPSSFVGAYMALHTLYPICEKKELKKIQSYFTDTIKSSSYYHEINRLLTDKSTKK